MPCSGCGNSGHNIRTCASGPTPGGVNGMRARAANAYNPRPTPNFGGFLTSFAYEPAHSTPIRESVPRFGEEIKLSEIKRIVNDVQVKVEDQISAINRRFDTQEKLMKKSNARDDDILDQIFNKLEIDSKKTQDSYKKLMNRIDVVKHETLDEIDVRFKSIYDRVVSVDQKTEENKKKILKNEKSINEIRSLVVYMVEKEEKKEAQAAKKDEIDLKLLLSEDEDSEEELMSQEEMLNLSVEMIKKFKKCRTKKDQFKVVTEMAMKYVKVEK